MINTPSFTKIGSGIQKLMGGHYYFFENMESRLKIHITTKLISIYYSVLWIDTDGRGTPKDKKQHKRGFRDVHGVLHDYCRSSTKY
jgi:hypothetical protein